MIKTHVTWVKGQTPPAQDIIDKITEMETQGKTDGTRVRINETVTQFTAERTWTDVNAANEWINWVTTYNPVSAVIVE